MKIKRPALRIALAQMRSTQDPWENLFTMSQFIQGAIERGCHLLCLPENCCYRGPKRSESFNREELFLTIKNGAIEDSSEFSKAFIELINNCPIAVSFGSVFENCDVPDRPFNAHLFYRPQSELIGYRKIHLFNFSGPNANYREADDFSAGKQVMTVDYLNWKFGLSICYDIRFPETYRKMVLEQGAQVLLIPAAFTAHTGKVHWSLLNQARAVENLSYVISSAQWGEHYSANGLTLECYGHALAIDPWGQILAELPERGDCLEVVELSPERLDQVRQSLPSLLEINSI